MSEKLLVALISGGAAFVGALVAFVGLWVTNNRTLFVTKKQKGYEHAWDKRAEILPEICARLRSLLDGVRSLVDQPIELQNEQGNFDLQVVAESLSKRSARTRELIQRVRKLSDYHEASAFWLPSDLSERIRDFTNLLEKRAEQYRELVEKDLAGSEKYAEFDARMSAAQEKIKHNLAQVEAIMESIREPLPENEKYQAEADLYDGMTTEQIHMVEFMRYYAGTQQTLREWLYKKGERAWKEIYTDSRNVLRVDDF